MSLLLCLFMAGYPNLLRPSQLGREIEKITEEAPFREAIWGIAVYAPLRDRLLYVKNGQKNFRPASNMKILTTLLAFEYLGPEFRFETEVGYTGRVENHTLEGDLVIRGGGDPGLSGHFVEGAFHTRDLMGLLVERIADSGIRHIRGDLLGAVDFFDRQAIQFSWEWDDIGRRYGTPVTPLSMNDGWIEIQLSVDEEGGLATEVFPEWNPDFELELNLTHEPGENTLESARIWGGNRFLLTGNLPPCSEERLQFSAWDPSLQFLFGLKKWLWERGITVAGRATLLETEANETRYLASLDSPGLAALAQVLMKESQNHYADCFLKTTAKMVTGEGSFEKGSELAREFLTEIARWSAGPSGMSMRDGSGLSAQNYVQPLQIVDLLAYGIGQPYRAQWLATFPVLGEEGTLERRGVGDGLAKGRVRAKTGYIFRSRSLSGYVETLSGEPLIFSMLANNYGGTTAQVNEAQDRICEILVRLKPSRKVRRQPDSRLPFSRLVAKE